MSLPNTASPFQCTGSVKQLGEGKVTQSVVLRVENLSGSTIYITINGSTPSSSNYQFYLNEGDTLELPATLINDLSQIQLINNTATNPKISWYCK